MIVANIAAEASEAKISGETQNNNTWGAVFLFWEDTLGSHTLTDEEYA